MCKIISFIFISSNYNFFIINICAAFNGLADKRPAFAGAATRRQVPQLARRSPTCPAK